MTARDELDALAADWRPWAVADRAVVLAAVEAAAAASGGEVHASTVREHLAREVGPHVPGGVICALVRQRVLVDTGQVRPSGDGTKRNRTKRLPVYRLTGPLPAA
ncbi:hypothetical protein N866_13575 [Actinotalea ferrariae CF5-4]|uniref:Uncharacterized protein n=1 Tax=Actinotalea ferrariae CF5-4 TaxID=948458 RepID=A0A021VW53_9CELL|nr:hypothetical protein [Actinotalea ferrariae]EYR64275.1 hypothetical protein N866_13575 [Actinotalea ferrariae CF5-4]